MEINKIIQGDALEVLKTLPDESINCVMTSPPYWALRDYGSSVESIWDGDKNCEHEWNNKERKLHSGTTKSKISGDNSGHLNEASTTDKFCQKCNAWKGQLGLEPTFDLYIKHLCNIFSEVKRVLRKDGTCWVNLGDTYASTPSGLSNEKAEEWNEKGDGLFNRLHKRNTNDMTSETTWKPNKSGVQDKSLCLIPFRFAIEMQNRGWILRNVIIWHKPNCMPCSVKDRFTVDFEYLFFFVKNKKYWFETQYEPIVESSMKDNRKDKGLVPHKSGKSLKQDLTGNPTYTGFNKRWQENQYAINGTCINSFGRNKRCVWDITTQPFPEAHFATYPEKLCETPIKSGCPEFVCNKCGKAREVIFEPTEEYKKILNSIKGLPSGDLKKGYQNYKNGTPSCLSDYKKVGYTDCGCKDYYCSNCKKFINLENIEYYDIQGQREKENICSELGEKQIQEIEISREKDRGNIILQRKRMFNLWKKILCEKNANVLFKELWGKMASQEGKSQYMESKEGQESQLEGRQTQNQWIPLPMESKSSESNEGWLCNGTPIDNGEAFEKDIKGEREYSSQKWNKDRQQNREFGISNSQQSLWRSYLSSLSKKFQSEIKCPFCFSENISLESAGFSGGIVLDPFFGAGTTGLVALKQNKKFIGIELNSSYIEIAKNRLKPYLEQEKLKC